MIDGKGLAQFLAAVVVIVALSCAPKATMVGGNGPKGPFGNGQETLDDVDGLGFTADSSYIKSYGATSLMFLARDKGQSINWQAALRPGAAGDVVAQVINVGNATFTDGGFTLAPSEVAYLWVGEVRYQGAPTRGSGVYKLSNTGYVAGEWSIAPLSMMKWCRNDAPRRKPSIKDHHPGPDNCEPIALAPGAKTTRLASLGVSTAFAAPAPYASMAFAAIGGLWISCAGGCCQISPN
jgi:hypothetical protein